MFAMQQTPRYFLALVSVSIGLCGCGSEVYDQRFKGNTLVFLNDQSQLDTNLTGEWQKRGIHMRLPAGFSEVPTPKDGWTTLRLPDRRELELPGILGVFTKEVAAVTSTGGTLNVPSRIAILSNREFLESRGATQDDPGGRIEPAKFESTVRFSFQEVLPTNAKVGDTEIIGGRNFQPTLRYDLSHFHNMGSQGIPYDISLYNYQQASGGVQVAVIVMAPHELARSESLLTQLPLSLRTLRIENPAAQGDGAGGGAPSGGPRF